MSAAVANLTWTGVSLLLIEASSRDLSGIDGAFGLRAPEWTVTCFTSGLVLALVGCMWAAFTSERHAAQASKGTNEPPDG